MIDENGIFRQIPDDHSTASDVSAPRQRQVPAGTVAQRVSDQFGSTFCLGPG